MKKRTLFLICLTALIWTTARPVSGRSFETKPPDNPTPGAATPDYCNAEHNIGNVVCR